MDLIFCFYFKFYERISIFMTFFILGSYLTCLSKFTFLWRLWPWKNSHIPWGEWEFYNIGESPSSSIFMKIPIYTSVVTVFIQVQNLFSSENGWKSLNFTRPRVVLTRNHKFKMSVILLESKLYLWKFVFLHSFGRGIRIYFHLSTKNTDNIFKMASLSVKRYILGFA